VKRFGDFPSPQGCIHLGQSLEVNEVLVLMSENKEKLLILKNLREAGKGAQSEGRNNLRS
jgi:hypothetical protein